MRIALIDNYDSFTNNILHALWRTGAAVTVVKNDDEAGARRAVAAADAIVLSPGPGHAGTPGDVGVMPAILRAEQRPILGICLGHQAMALAEGGRIARSPLPVHGERWTVLHEGRGLFAGLPDRIDAVRYHSWAVEDPVPPAFAVDARTPEGVVMAIRHLHRPRWGLQFHPESIDTAAGESLIRGFLTAARGAPVAPAGAVPRQAAERQVRSAAGILQAAVSRFSVRESGAVLFGNWTEGADGVLLDGARADGEGRRVSVLARAADPGNAVLTYDAAARRLETVRAGEKIVSLGGLQPLLSALLAPSVPALADLPLPFKGGLLGYVGYEGRAAFGWDAPGFKDGTPDAAFLYARSFVLLDEIAQEAVAVSLHETGERDAAEAFARDAEAALSAAAPPPSARPSVPDDKAPVTFSLRDGEAAYAGKIARCRALIEAGESYELCLTNRLSAPPLADPWAVHQALRSVNPAPYAAFVRLAGVAVSSSSPERFFRLSEDGLIEAKPIKGTIGRHADPAEDAVLAARLAASRKDRAENLMITDLLRHDVGAVAEPGSVRVPVLAGIESYETVHQMVSTVQARARPDVGPLGVLAALFPGGSMTGAPKRRTVSLLETLEGAPRGIYSGALGWMSHGGAADMSIVIRAVVATDTSMSIGCGGAITILSDSEDEFAEIMLKAETQMRAIALAATGDPRAYRVVSGEEEGSELPREAWA